MISSRGLAGALLLAYGLVVAFIVFWPTADVATGSVLGIWTLIQRIGAPGWISAWAIEFVTNALMFMPLSFLGSTFKPHWGWRHWLVAGLAGSSAIELTQWLLLSGRSAQLADVASNTLGALAGYGVVVARRRTEALSASAGDHQAR
ncbi:MAG TPA: VanZ family protein [Nocardioidaceae bacterium]